MLALIFTVIFSVVVAYFATQNTGTLTLHLMTYTWSGIPIYLVMLVSLLAGLLFAWILHLLGAISSSFVMRGKDQELREERKANIDLTKRVHQLELENTKLTAKEGNTTLIDDNSL